MASSFAMLASTFFIMAIRHDLAKPFWIVDQTFLDVLYNVAGINNFIGNTLWTITVPSQMIGCPIGHELAKPFWIVDQTFLDVLYKIAGFNKTITIPLQIIGFVRPSPH